MPAFGDIIYNITDLYVAPLSGATFSDPVRAEYVQSLSFEFTSDEDDIKAFGITVEKLAIPIHATGSLSEASLNWAALAAMTGMAESLGGSTPTETKTTDILGGGSGLPYFGLIAQYAAIEGNMLIGFPKCKLSTVPGFTVEQNQFRTSEIGITMLAPSATIRKIVRYRKNETAAAVPTSAANFQTFFAGMFS